MYKAFSSLAVANKKHDCLDYFLPSTGYESTYKKDLCSGTNNDTVAPQVKENGIRFLSTF